MKLYHFTLTFVIIALVIIIVLDIKTDDFKAVIKNKEQIDRNLDAAIDDGAARLVQVDDNNNILINKDAAIESFYISLNSSFHILEDQDAIQKLNLYIPVVIVTMEDGYYIFYSDTYKKSDGSTCLSKRWSEKFPYFYEDEDFIYGFTLGDTVKLYDKNAVLDAEGDQTVYVIDYHDLRTMDEYAAFRTHSPDSILLSEESFTKVKKSVMLDCIESSMAYYASHHNRIASQYGITYNFSLSDIRENEWDESLKTNSMFVVFQGYPYGDETGETYNRVASAAAKINKKEVYYIEQVGWYLVYHRSTCPKLKKEEKILYSEEPFYNVEECVRVGAYAAPCCNKEGAYGG